MIFVAKADGGVTYVSPEWSAFTGCGANTAMEQGLAAVPAPWRSRDRGDLPAHRP